MSEQQNTEQNEELIQDEIPGEELSEVSGGATMVELGVGGHQ